MAERKIQELASGALPRWSDLAAVGRRGAVRLALFVLALELAFFAAVQSRLPESSQGDERGLAVAAPTHKLFVLFVDGLRPDNVPKIPAFDALSRHGFSALVQPCIDRLTIPCLTEAYTGQPSAGLLGPWENLVSGGAETKSHLFRDVRDAGLRVAVAERKELSRFRRWFTERHSDEATALDALRRWIRDGVDLIVYDYDGLDDAIHHHPYGTPEYDAAVAMLAETATTIAAELPVDYELVVFGDHGHTDDGRHMYGLDVPTVFLASGRTFGSTPVEGRIPIATYRLLLGAELGILPPTSYAGADLRSRLPEGSAIRAAAARRDYAPPAPLRKFPWWSVLPLIGLVILAARAAPPARSSPIWAVGLAGTTLLSGALYVRWLPLIHYNPNLPIRPQSVVVLLGLAVAAGAAVVLRGRVRPAVGFSLALLWCVLPGTLYEYGLYENLCALLLLGVAVTGIPRVATIVRARWHERPRRDFLRDPVVVECVLAGGTLLLGAWMIQEVTVMNWAITKIDRLEAYGHLFSPLAWGVFAGAFRREWRERLALGAVAALGGAGWVPLPAWATAFGTVLCVASAIRSPVALIVAAAWMSPVWYGSGGGLGVVCTAATAIAVCRLVPAQMVGAGWVRGLSAIGLVFTTFALSTKLRTNGLDFGFATQWFPGDLHERFWWIIALATVVKMVVPAIVIMRCLERFADVEWFRSAGTLVGSARIAANAIFLFGVLTFTPDAPLSRIRELVEDGIVWTMALFLCALAPMATGGPASEARAGE